MRFTRFCIVIQGGERGFVSRRETRRSRDAIFCVRSPNGWRHTESTKFTENKFVHGVRTQNFRQNNIRTYSLQTIFKHTIIL